MLKLTIFKRLALGFLVILLIVTAIGIYSTLKLSQLNQIIRSISSIDNEAIRLANNLRDAVLTQRNFDKKYVVSKDQDFHRQFIENEKYIIKDLNVISILMSNTENMRLINNIIGLYNAYSSMVDDEFRFIQSDKEYQQESYEQDKETVAEQIIYNLDNLVKISKAAIENKIAISGNIGFEAFRVVGILTILSVIMGILIAFYNARTINRPIVSLIKGTKEIARGNFEEYLTIPSPPEINELANSFNHMCDRLKELDEMKADLISHISHEFRTPLAVIREAISLHRDCISTGPIEKQRRLLSIIEEECERLIVSVNKIINLSRMDTGMMDYIIEECSLSQIIEMSLSKIKPIAESKKISIDLYLAGILPNVAIDTEKIGQVFDNLLENAMKFTPEKGKVFVKAALEDGTHSPNKEKRFIEVSISDTGCGIPEEHIHDIFDKFKKLHEKGTGLGLYIARQIVRAHGGNIWVRNEENTGSTFSFTVPVFSHSCS